MTTSEGTARAPRRKLVAAVRKSSAGAARSSQPIALWFALLASGCGGASEVGSVGAVLSRDAESGDVFVKELGDPKVRDGLLPGDQLLMVDGVYVRDLSTADVRRYLRGAPGSEVRLTVARGPIVVRLRVRRTALADAGPTK